MKKQGLLLACMLLAAGGMAYAAGKVPQRRSETYTQTDLGAELAETAQAGQTVVRKPESGYAYSMLPAEEQTIYLEIRDALLSFQENVKLSGCDKEMISHAFRCVLCDHPEMFYVDGYTYTEYTLGDMIKKITFTGSYRFSREQIAQKQAQIDAYAAACLAGMPDGSDEYEKVKYIYEYLIHHTEYDAAAQDNQNICSVFIEGRSVCQGYAKATQYLLNRAGVFATLVFGSVVGGEGHAWNLVRIDGAYYYVDTTWGDASYQAVGEDNAGDGIPTINYDYLCVSADQISLTHRIDNLVPLPACTSMDANYYVREGFYFTEWDEAKIGQVFREGYEKGNAYVTLKCAGYDVYSRIHEALIENQQIFRYLDCPDGLVSFSENEGQYSLSFWL